MFTSKKRLKGIAIFLLLQMVIHVFSPLQALALTGGPTQPEAQGFTPIGVSDLVNPFTGDFTYNIPLLEIDGYPINLAYNSGITSDAEASWVGLGWNINPGAINRSMRGLPDDFKNDKVKKEYNLKNNTTVGATFRGDLEIFEKELDLSKLKDLGLTSGEISVGYSLGISCNNYNGYNIEQTVKPSISATNKNKGKLNASLGITSGTNGLTISPDIGFEHYMEKSKNKSHLGLSLGTSFNSRQGLKALTISATGKKPGIPKGSVSTSISFGLNSYTPTINMPMKNFAADFSFKVGGTLLELFGNMNISGYVSQQALRLNDGVLNVGAYGYNYSQDASRDATGNIHGLMDVNRDWDGQFNLNTPSLPITNYTYDILSVSGQGVSGSFRPFRNDIGYLSDNYAANTSSSVSFGGELGGGNIFKGGIDFTGVISTTVTSSWADDNDFASNNFYSQKDPNNPLYEPTSYKQMGELSVDEEEEFYNTIGRENVARLELEGKGFKVRARNRLVNSDGAAVGNLDHTNRADRQKRNQVMEVLTVGEIQFAGTQGNDEPTFGAPEHHIGEIRVVRNDGARYVYGVPAYNTKQEETSFAVGIPPSSENNYYSRRVHNSLISQGEGLIQYTQGVDNSIGNKKGKDNFYSSTEMPPFAHSFLLSAVLSPDYVDADNTAGPSDGDLGNYTLFKYDKIDEPYRWRTPYGDGQANFSEGLKSNPQDDKANYVYGEKEIWYLTQIESKHTIAIFHTEDRHDGYGVRGRDGGRSTVTTKLLRKISLYSRESYLDNPSTAVPIKEVHFEYDYSLCPNVPNNDEAVVMENGVDINANKGKLTLKKVYFTYGNSFKSKFSPYEFDYTNIYSGSFNPEYGMKNYDRWGNYKPNDLTGLNNADYPYVGFDKTLTDKYATAWTMSKITLPSGGTIQIECESDDYAYVQDKAAMDMMQITSINGDISGLTTAQILASGNNNLMEPYDPIGGSSNDINQIVTFKLQDVIPFDAGIADEEEFFRRYLDGIEDLYFKFLVDVTGRGDYEYISGFTTFSKTSGDYGLFGLNGSSEYEYGWFTIDQVHQNEKESSPMVHPISRTAWHFGRMNMPKQVYNEFPAGDGCGLDDFLKSVENGGFVSNLIQTFKGANGYLKDKNCGKKVNLEKSFVRLNSPYKSKLGGGIRVKKIVSTDEWSTMAGGANFDESYGMLYDYTTTDPATGETISSGVAQFEPGVGGDENPFKLPIWHGDKTDRLLVPHDKSYLMGPAGESYYPSPTVGYSKVTITSLTNDDIIRHATGKNVKEFYTAKDFPTIVNSTTLDPRDKKTNPFFNLFKLYYREYMTVSQGFVIELNDMHGKPKAEWVYAEGATEYLSGVEYKYKSEKYNNRSSKLTNSCTVVHPDGSVSEKEVGVEFDFTVDLREQESESVSQGIKANGGTFLAAVIPGFVPFAMPTATVEKTRFRSAVVTKVISRYGILEETIAHDLGAAIATKNHAYDAETGLVLLTSTTNNFDDPLYSFNYPAHWYYDQMGQAYKNLGAQINDISFSTTGIGTVANAEDYFVPGDEVVCTSCAVKGGQVSDVTMYGWVTDVTGDQVTIINKAGGPLFISDTKSLRVVRSGRRNLIGISMGSIVSNSNPLESLTSNHFGKILNSSAQVFKNEWPTFCECSQSSSSLMTLTDNPYVTGKIGTWRPYKSYAYLTDREYTWKNKNTAIRTDGYYTRFNPFWVNSKGTWGLDENNWTWTKEITKVSPYGAQLEEQDALLRHSAAIYGYNRIIPTAVGQNMEYREIAFDGFEDYDYITCSSDHFSFKGLAPNIITDIGHTGMKYIMVNTSGITLTKQLGECE